jgi:hypothetical protein
MTVQRVNLLNLVILYVLFTIFSFFEMCIFIHYKNSDPKTMRRHTNSLDALFLFGVP